MSKKFKNGDKVVIKSTGEIGVVKGRDVVKNEKDKHVEVQYIVKIGDGIHNWKAFDKKDLTLVRTNVEVYPKYYTKSYTKDGREVTLTGIVDKLPYPDDNMRVLSIGHALLHPNDMSDAVMGRKISTRRAKTRPVCDYASVYKNGFDDEIVEAIMERKSKYIFDNIEKFSK